MQHALITQKCEFDLQTDFFSILCLSRFSHASLWLCQFCYSISLVQSIPSTTLSKLTNSEKYSIANIGLQKQKQNILYILLQQTE